MDKYAVFIDGGYLRNILNDLGKPKFDYLKFSEFVAEDDQRLRTYYYDCAPYIGMPPTKQQKELKRKFDKFENTLRRLKRFEVRLGKLKKVTYKGDTKYEQKMVDILLAIDLVKLSVEKSIQRAVIITNDTDFVPAIKVARDAGVIVKLYRGKSHYNDALLDACDECEYIDKKFVSALHTRVRRY